MAYTNIDLPTDYFNTTAYTGDGVAGRNLTTGTFQPDWVWIKSRSDTDNHRLVDAVRGATKHLESDTTGAEQTSLNVTAFTSTGITLSSNGAVNANAETYVSWNWKANGTGVSNTAGTISSTVSANTTAGFSIVSYSGNGTGGATIGHGLGVVPKMFIIKERTDVNPWVVYHASIDVTGEYTLRLDETSAKTNANATNNNTAPTSSLITLGTSSLTNGSLKTYIAYCFAEIKGYSKFGSYTGNGNADGTFVYTGFKPAFVLLKSSSNSGWNWRLSDNKRDNFNSANNKNLFPSSSDAEVTSEKDVDFLSNGFKLRTNDNGVNTSGWTIIYMAFAENPFVSSTGIPTTAR